MTEIELLAGGYRKYPPHTVLDRFDALFQKTIRDEKGKRYSVNIRMWDHTKYNADYVGWDVELRFNDGCDWYPHNTIITADCNDVTTAEVQEWAEQVWLRLGPSYYELNEG